MTVTVRNIKNVFYQPLSGFVLYILLAFRIFFSVNINKTLKNPGLAMVIGFFHWELNSYDNPMGFVPLDGIVNLTFVPWPNLKKF